MKVDTKHEQYASTEAWWSRARDAYEGEDAVKRGGTKYLPKLGVHQDSPQGDERYRMYVMRASFYNAVGRTVDGLAGAALRSDPQIEVPKNIEDHIQDLTLKAQPLELAAQQTVREVLTTGRQGLLVDFSDELQRPYVTFWKAEDVVNWKVEYRSGQPVLTMVVLREFISKQKDDDVFVVEEEETYRVLTLTDGVYASTQWRKDKTTGDWHPEKPIVPKRTGKTLDFIPFVFVNPTSITPDVEKPPLLDLINVNLSHYRNSADLEHGLHFVGVPQIVIMGAPQSGNDTMEFGSSVVWVLDQGSDAKILQADGETLGALERVLDRKKKDMATLGARMLEDQAQTQETATAVLSRSSGEHATLGSIASAVEAAYTWIVQVMAWWAPGAVGNDVDTIEAEIQLSKDFTALKIDPQMLRELVVALQAEAISYETFWSELAKRGFGRPVDWEEELKAIEEGADGAFQKPEPPPMIPGQIPEPQKDDDPSAPPAVPAPPKPAA